MHSIVNKENTSEMIRPRDLLLSTETHQSKLSITSFFIQTWSATGLGEEETGKVGHDG
jgi:hypothetical protein